RLPVRVQLSHPSPTTIHFPYTTLFRSFGRDEQQQILQADSRLKIADQKWSELERRLGFTRQKHAGDDAHAVAQIELERGVRRTRDRKSTRLNSSHQIISYAVFFLIKKI